MNKQFLDKLAFSAKIYNEQRLHTDFQEDEILKFLAWLHKTYGIEYTKPKARHENTPEIKQYWKGVS